MLGVYNCLRCHKPMLTKGLCQQCSMIAKREPQYSSEAVRKALEEADEVHRQIEEATRPRDLRASPFSSATAKGLQAHIETLESLLKLRDSDIYVAEVKHKEIEDQLLQAMNYIKAIADDIQESHSAQWAERLREWKPTPESP